MAACCDPLVEPTLSGFECSSKLEIAHSYHFYQRVLALVDHNIYGLYVDKINAYFSHHGIKATLHRSIVEEDRKDMDTMLSFCEAMNKLGILRREPVLVVGGRPLTDVADFSIYIFRRGTPYIRVPTTLVGLIEASVSNGVAVNWNGLKNHVDGYHEPAATFIDYTFLRYIPEAETRNGTSEASDEGYSSSKSEKELEWEEMHPGMEAEERTDRVFAPRAISVAEQSAGHVKESRQKAFR